MKTKILKIIVPFLPGSFILPAVIIWNLREDKGIIVWAFVAGLIADLFSAKILGTSSLFFLAVILSINLIKTWQRFNLITAIFLILIFDYLYGWL